MDDQFHFNVVPIPGKTTVSTRIVFQDDLTQAEIVATAAAATGLTAAQATAIGTSIFTQVITAARSGRRTRRLFDLYSFTPRCGGVQTDPGFQPTADNMNLALNGSLSPAGDALLADGITFHRDGVLGDKTPHVTRVYDAATRLLDVVTAGGSFRLSGDSFGPEPDPTDTQAGVFLRLSDGSLVQIHGFSGWTDTEITGTWPTAAGGTMTLLVAAQYPSNSGPSLYTYPTPLPVTN